MARFIEIEFSQLNLIVSELQAVSRRASDIKPVARTVALVISSYTDSVFDSAPSTKDDGIVFNGEKWEKLSDKYLDARRKQKKKSKNRDNGFQLRDTGALLNSLQVGNSANAFESGRDFIEFGTNLPQGFNNATRPFLVHTDALSELVEKAISNYIITGEI